ncbi:MAG: AmmeMemoRadiSam system protein A [Syntrophomonadaceae bacterium]|nr:AmmeMemoRadiSam system protein A [Syntrophomonadaceae bacterium]
MIAYAALSPHPPLIVPEIGGSRLKEVQSTVDGMQQMARELAASSPETIVFLTPHGNVFADALSSLGQPILKGYLANFGARQKWQVSNDLELLREIAAQSTAENLPFVILDQEIAQKHRLNPNLDHGILVPLYYLQEAGLTEVSLVAISIAFLPNIQLYQFGQVLQQAADKIGRKVAILASGDMSHRLKSDGPYQFHPDGPVFDQTIRDLLQAGDVEGVLNLPETLCSNAGECGYRSIVIMLGALDGMDFQPQVFSYEGPYGVGYLIAGFKPGPARESLLSKLQARQRETQEQRRRQESPPVRWARMVIESYIGKKPRPKLPKEMEYLRNEKAGAFVSIKKHGQLRGCIGTISPAYGDLAEEIAGNAISAATRDPRFLPFEEHELEDLVYSVDILGKPEPATRDQLDPKRYGVIVTKGSRRGLLLPDLEGVDTVEEQLRIACQKAGIRPDEDYSIERFEVVRYT